MAQAPKYKPLSRFILRTPLFPLAAAGELDRLQHSDVFKEAIYLASPDLAGGNLSSDAKKQQKYEESLLKYHHRACTRPTPFGLFAGCTVGTLDEQTAIELLPPAQNGRCTRLDMQYLCALIQQIERTPEVRMQLRYYPNDSLYPNGGKYRYIEYHYKNSHRRHNIASLEIDEALDQVLEGAANGATIDELAALLIDEEITRDEALAYINEVIDAQVLKSELDPGVVGGDTLSMLIEKLRPLKEVALFEPLVELQELLSRIDAQPIGTTLPIYEQIIDQIKTIGVGYELKYLFQTDLVKPAREAHISTAVTDRITGLIDFLARITPAGDHPTLTAFTRAFQSRYEEQEVPLMQVLDAELGIGYPASSGGGNDLNPLVDDLALPGGQRGHISEVRMGPADRVLFRKYLNSIRRGERVVSLTDEDFKELTFTHRLPDTLAVMCSLLDGERLHVRSIGGSSGANLIGRFCHLDPGITELAAEVARLETQANPDVLFAEVAHLPESRIGNIASRPALRDYTLHYLSNCDRDGRDIPVQDLLLSVRNGRLHLRSKRYDKQVVPRLTCAHNYSSSPIPVYRFLCDLQHLGRTPGLQCSWNDLYAAQEYMPAIEYNGLLLTRQQWRIKPDEVKDFGKMPDQKLGEAFAELLLRRELPPHVVIPDHDNELYLDLRQTSSQRMLLNQIEKRKGIQLKEFLFDPATAIVRQEGATCSNEVIFVFHKQ